MYFFCAIFIEYPYIIFKLCSSNNGVITENDRSWIKRIVINHCLNEIKRRKADLQFFDDMSAFNENKHEEVSDAGLSVENVRKAMEFLPSGSKMIFSLYLLEGYDHREIAQILNVSESNSKSQYMRAKQKVKEILKEKSHEAR